MRCSPDKQRGFTLLEVVVGLTMMASVLVASLLAFSSHRKQLAAADRRIAAVAVADELLETLSNNRDGFPRAGRGPIPGQANWFWQTNVVGTTSPMEIPMAVIRLSIMEANSQGEVNSLVTVEVVEALK